MVSLLARLGVGHFRDVRDFVEPFVAELLSGFSGCRRKAVPKIDSAGRPAAQRKLRRASAAWTARLPADTDAWRPSLSVGCGVVSWLFF